MTALKEGKIKIKTEILRKKFKKIISSDNQGGDRDFIFTLQQ